MRSPQPCKRIPLFDIDGTLLQPGNVLHAKSFELAFAEVFNLQASVSEIETSGMTDAEILIEIATLRKIPLSVIETQLPKALQIMATYYEAQRKETSPLLLPGVQLFLSKLRDHQITIGLLSGNIETIAWDKLRRTDIASFFSFGAFGNMASKRAALVEIAQHKAAAVLQRPVVLNDLIVIGDTPKDIACAKAMGAISVGVATGAYSFEGLSAQCPDLVIHSLQEAELLFDLIFRKD